MSGVRWAQSLQHPHTGGKRAGSCAPRRGVGCGWGQIYQYTSQGTVAASQSSISVLTAASRATLKRCSTVVTNREKKWGVQCDGSNKFVSQTLRTKDMT